MKDAPPPQIHPQALVATGARLGAGVVVGPFAVVEDDVDIGPGCRIGPHAVVRRYVSMGAGNRVEPFAVLGGPAQDLSCDPETPSYVAIGDDCTFREGVTVHRAGKPGGTTRVGSRCFLMSNSHVAHDCTVGDGVIFASGATIGGHVQVGDGAFLGGGAMVHQHCRVGAAAMVRGLSAVDKDILPYALAAGTPVRHYRLNLVGLRRRGLDAERIRILSEAFRHLRSCAQTSRYLASLADLPDTVELTLLRAWLFAESRRGIHPFANRRLRSKNADSLE